MIDSTAILKLFAKGALSGFLYSLICLGAELLLAEIATKHGKKNALIAGYGIGTMHIIWAAISTFALSFTFKHLSENQGAYTLAGSILMFYFAFLVYKDKQRKKRFLLLKKPPQSRSKKVSSFFKGLFFSLASPGKIIGYAILFSALGVSQTDPDLSYKLPLIFGVFIGAFLWWSIYVRFFMRRAESFSSKKMKRLKKLASLSFIIIGVIGLIHGLQSFR